MENRTFRNKIFFKSYQIENKCFSDIFYRKYFILSYFRASSELLYAEAELDGILAMLSESDLLEEKGDILQYLVDTYGLEYDTGIQIFF